MGNLWVPAFDETENAVLDSQVGALGMMQVCGEVLIFRILSTGMQFGLKCASTKNFEFILSHLPESNEITLDGMLSPVIIREVYRFPYPCYGR